MAELVTLDEYKTYKGINSTEKDDQIRYIVSAVNSLVKNYCNRSFVDHYSGADLTVYFDGTSTDLVYLDEIPITTIVSVSVSSDGGVTETALVENTDYFVDLEEGTVQTVTGSFFSAGYAHHSLKVVYAGGYEVAPEDLKIACLDLVDYYKNEEYTPKKTMRMVGEIVGSTAKTLPPHIKRVMDLYRIIY
jgi:hypothetical protein